MGFRGTPYEDIELKVDWDAKLAWVLCDNCGAELDRRGFEFNLISVLMRDYEIHLTDSHKRQPKPKRCSVLVYITLNRLKNGIAADESQCIYNDGHGGPHRYEFSRDD